MPAPVTTTALLELVRKSGIVSEPLLDEFLQANDVPVEPNHAAGALIRAGLITRFQSQLLLAGKHRGFLIGQLKVLEQLGVGGMGVVFLCEQTALRRKVAVKILPQKQSKDPVTRERFYREGRAAAALDHPNIVRVHDINTHGGIHYLVMEYVEGTDLQHLIHDEGALPFKTAVDYVMQAAEGLQHAHERGLVHRDIKPANLLVDSRGHLKILDMGLARFFQDDRDDLTNRYEQGAMLGTVDYLAPEQAIQSSTADIRADIYSLGVTLYALITGKPPFGGNTTEKLMHHQVKIPEPLCKLRPDIPKKLAAAVAKMMAKDPVRRYQTPIEVRDALAAWSTEPPRSSPQPKPTKTPKKSVRTQTTRSMRPIVLAASVAVVAAVAGAVWALSRSDEGPKAASAPTAQNASVPPIVPEAQPATKTDPTPPVKKEFVPPPKKDPPTSSAGAPMLRLNLAQQEPAKVRMKGADVVGNPTGSFPKGWFPQAWNRESTMEASVEDFEGTKVIGLRNLQGTPAAMLFTPELTVVEGNYYEVTVEYRSDADGQLSYRRLDGAARKAGELQATQGMWKQTHLAFVAAQTGPSLLEFHGWGIGEAQPFYLRKVEVRDLGSNALATKGAVYRHDFSNDKPFTQTYERYAATTTSGNGKLPEGWGGGCWKEGDTARLGIEAVGDTQALSIRNTMGSTFQLSITKPFDSLPVERAYLLRFSYLAEAKVSGEFEIRPQPWGSYATGIPLKPTQGTWQEMELYFAPEKGNRFQAYFQSYSSGDESGIYVKNFEILPFPTEGLKTTSVYRIDWDKQAPFGFWMKGEELLRQTGDGDWPKHWQGSVENPETVGELSLETTGNVRGLKLDHNDGPKSSVRLNTKEPLAMLRAGRRYSIQVVYQSDSEAAVTLELKRDPKTASIFTMKLPRSELDRRGYGVVYQPTQDMPLHLTIGNSGAAKDGKAATLRIASIEVNELVAER